MASLDQMKDAKRYSDARQYPAKHSLLHSLIKNSPKEFYIDSDDGAGIVGLTHEPTGFRIHAPRQVVQDLGLENRSKAAAAPAIDAGFGLPTPGGTVSKMVSPTSRLKGKLTNDTLKDDPASADSLVANPADDMFKATREFQARKLNPAMKRAQTVANIQKYTGYRPGFWYDEGSFSPDEQRRMGNLVTGAGLSAAGLAAIPVLQYLFPKRFKRKTAPLAGLALLGGMSAPWLATLPGTVRDIQGKPDNTGYTPDYIDQAQTASDQAADRLRQPGAKTASMIPMDLQLSKAHLADTLEEQWRRGHISYGQALGLMNRVGQQEPKPWLTVGNLAHAAIGAGAGAVAGTVAAKGIGLFMNLGPTERKVMQGTGAALGTLINLGKLGIR